MDNPIVYVVINGELNMSPGKAAAQAVHAASMLDNIGQFGENVKRTVIVLEANNSQQLFNLHYYLDACGIDSAVYIDEGMNEVDAYSATALAAGLVASDDTETRDIFSQFPLFGKQKKKKRFLWF